MEPNFPRSQRDAQIAALAARQHGNVTRDQLKRLGLGTKAIDYRVRTGRLHRVHRGVYAVGRPPCAPLERAAAAVLACGPGAALSHTSALKLWEFAKYWPQGFDVVLTAGDRRGPETVRIHRCPTLQRQDIRTQHGIRATSPARTLLDCAPLLDPKTRTRTVNDALHTAYLKRNQLAEVCARYPRHPGAKLLGAFYGTTDGPTRSGWVDELIAFCERFGLPRPRINFRIHGREVDAYFEAEKLIVELDSWEFHRDRQAFEADRDRDAEMLDAGIDTVRITWKRIREAPDAEAARLRRILARRRGRPG